MTIFRSIQLIIVICFALLTALACTEPAVQPADITPEGVHSETVSPTPSLTASPELTATISAANTIEPQQAMDRVVELLSENGGCELPCWWGIEPGSTAWPDAEAILSPVASRIHLYAQRSSLSLYDVLVPVPKEIFPVRLEYRFEVEGDVVQKTEVIVGNVDRYRLSKLLNDFGAPREVWLTTYSKSRAGSLPFAMVLYYPDRGILAQFGNEATVEGDFVVSCPRNDSASILVLWSPDRAYPSFEAAVNDTLRLGSFKERGYHRLEEVTDLDAGAFFETFRTANDIDCIYTEASHWPSP